MSCKGCIVMGCTENTGVFTACVDGYKSCPKNHHCRVTELKFGCPICGKIVGDDNRFAGKSCSRFSDMPEQAPVDVVIADELTHQTPGMNQRI